MSWGTTTTQLVVMFVLFMIAHSVVIYLANLLFPNAVVLGTSRLTPGLALLNSMVVFTIIAVGMVPILEYLAKLRNMRIMDMHWMVLYFLINFVGLWLVARAAETLGLGLSSWRVVAILAIVLDAVQGLAVKLAVERAR